MSLRSLAARRWLHAPILLLSMAVSAQEGPSGTGSVRGIVRRAVGDLPVSGATVRLLTSGLETTTDGEGRFTIAGVPVGPERVIASHPELLDSLPRNVDVPSAGFADVELKLRPKGENVLTVQGLSAEKSAAKITKEQKSASGVKSSIGREEVQSLPVSDVSQAARTLPSVTVQDDLVFVRGLGDRYSQTLVNGTRPPSPQPDKRATPLDLFPASIIDTISIAKTYSADLPGEFAGGSVQVDTIDIPEAGFFRFSLGLEYVDGTTFRDFHTYQGGNLDMLGYDDGTRELPGEVPQDTVRGGSEGRGLSPEDLQTIGRSFPNIWERDTTSAPPNWNVKTSFGNRYETEGGLVFGFVGAIDFENEYLRKDDEKFRLLKNQGTSAEPEPFVFNDFDLDTSTFTTQLTALLNLAVQYESTTVGLRNLYTHASEDQVRFQTGFEGQQGVDTQITRLDYTERGLLSNQLYGEHLLVGDTLFEWRASYALSQRDQPDTRQVRYDFDEIFDDFRYQDVSESGSRDYYILDENIYDTGLDLSVPWPFWEDPYQDPSSLIPRQKIKLGASYLLRDRDFDARRFRFKPQGTPEDESGNRIDLTVPFEDLFSQPNINPNGFEIEEDTRPTDSYDAEQELWALYGLVDFRVLEVFRVELGVRAEDSDQQVNTFELFGETNRTVTTNLHELDVLPALNLAWEFFEVEPGEDDPTPEPWEPPNRQMQIRAGASQTVSRPEFRELAPFEFTDVAGGFTARGNPELERAKIINLDLGWEWYPEPGDLVSAYVFYKNFDSPIEQVILPTGSQPLTTWENADSAQLYGFEIEFRKHLGFIDDWIDDADLSALEQLKLLVNYAWMESEVELDDEQGAIQTNSSRKLQGQPDYVLNLGLLWEIPDWGLTLGVLANTFGERITRVGSDGVPDEVEEPRWQLDLTVSKKFEHGGSIRLTAKNLLDEKYEFKQGDITSREYTIGFTLGLSYSLSF